MSTSMFKVVWKELGNTERFSEFKDPEDALDFAKDPVFKLLQVYVNYEYIKVIAPNDRVIYSA